MTNDKQTKSSVCQCILPLIGPNVVFVSCAKVKCEMTNKPKLECANVMVLF